MIFQRRIQVLILIVLVGLAVGLRFYELERRPTHHDEGVNGNFIVKLVEKNRYFYQGRYYHGPSLIYAAQVPARIFGISTHSIRMVPALFGFLLCLTPFLVRFAMGFKAATLAAFLLALAPGLLFYSRYAIHEIIFCFFTVLTALLGFRFLEERRLKWLLLMTAALASAAATKETIVMNFAAIVGAGVLVLCVREKWQIKNVWLTIKKTIKPMWVLLAAVLFLVVLYLWFFAKIGQLQNFFKSFKFFFDLSTKHTGHEKPWYYYLKILSRYEWLVWFAALGGIVRTYFERKPFYLFCSFWSLLTLIAYSIISYKTPWLIVSIIAPFTFLAAYFLIWPLQVPFKKTLKWIYVFTLIPLVLFWIYGSVALSFWRFEEDRNLYCYVHTYASAHDLERKIKSLLDRDLKARLLFISDENWPYPFLLHTYRKRIDYRKKFPTSLDYPIIVVRDKYHDEFIPKANKPLIREDYKMRPGVNFELYWDSNQLDKKI